MTEISISNGYADLALWRGEYTLSKALKGLLTDHVSGQFNLLSEEGLQAVRDGVQAGTIKVSETRDTLNKLDRAIALSGTMPLYLLEW